MRAFVFTDPALTKQALAYAESLPVGQRSEGTIKAVEKKLGTPPGEKPAG